MLKESGYVIRRLLVFNSSPSRAYFKQLMLRCHRQGCHRHLINNVEHANNETTS